MTDEERAEALEKALEDFKKDMAAAHKEFDDRIRDIMKEIDEKKAEEIKKNI